MIITRTALWDGVIDEIRTQITDSLEEMQSVFARNPHEKLPVTIKVALQQNNQGLLDVEVALSFSRGKITLRDKLQFDANGTSTDMFNRYGS